MSSDLVRLSLSIEKPLFEKLEAMVNEKEYANRSEFVRDMIRREIVSEQWDAEKEVVATITLIFDHHKRELSEKLTEMQHDHHALVLASTHVHLDTHICAEMIMLKGEAGKVRKLAFNLGRQTGVLHYDLSMSSTGAELK